MTFDPAAAARALFDARHDRRPAGPLPPHLAPADAAAGVATQLELARLMGALPPAGFKIGATAKRMQDYLGLAEPAAGFMPRDCLHATGVELRWDAFRSPGVECEIAIRLATDLPPGPCTPAQAETAVGAVFAGIEIVENRYGAPPSGDIAVLRSPTLTADQVFHAGAVLGDAVPRAGLDLGAARGRLRVDGVVRGEGVGADLLGHPMAALAWLAGSPVAAVFGGLQPGQIIMLGSVTPPIWLDGPCHVEVAFDGLPPVTLRFI